MAVTMAAPAKTHYTKHSRPAVARAKTPVVAYTLAGCPDCAAFKQYLQQSGVRMTTSYTRSRDVSLFPTVVYSDGTSDHGERVYGRQVQLPRALRIVETD
jgi:hypothetical protein